MITTPSGLQYEDTTLGQGDEARAGRPVQVHYTGWLYQDGVAGRKFDSSKDRGQPFDPCTTSAPTTPMVSRSRARMRPRTPRASRWTASPSIPTTRCTTSWAWACS